MALELGKEYKEGDLTSEGFRRTRRIEGGNFPSDTWRHERGNKIYIVHETDQDHMRPLAYYDLETGEHTKFCGDK